MRLCLSKFYMNIEHEHPANDNEMEVQRDLWHPDASRRTTLVDKKGKKIPGATAELKVVNGPEQMMPHEIDVEGKQDINDARDTEVGKTESPREKVKEKIKLILRKLDTIVYRAGDINEVALGHRVDLEQGPRDFTYVIRRADAQRVKEAFAQAVVVSVTDTGLQFSNMSKNNKLEPAGLGFTRTLESNGEIYRVNFLYANDHTKAANDNGDEHESLASVA